jgi:hypothetical protein
MIRDLIPKLATKLVGVNALGMVIVVNHTKYRVGIPVDGERSFRRIVNNDYSL